MPNIDQFQARSGRLIKEDGTVVNEANGINPDGSRNVQLTGSIIAQPFDHQATLTDTKQTHSGVIVAPSASNIQSAWQQVPEGMTEIATNQTTDIGNSGIYSFVEWSEDGTNRAGKTGSTLPTSGDTAKSSVQWFPVCGAFYKLGIVNGHTAPITASANIKFRP